MERKEENVEYSKENETSKWQNFLYYLTVGLLIAALIFLYYDDTDKQATINNLNSEISNQNVTIQTLNNEISSKDSTIQTLNDEISSRDVTIQSLNEEIASLSSSKSSSTSSSTTSSTTNSYTVYITNTGSKYHKSSCSYLKYSKIAIDKNSAINQGYTACSRCNP